MPAEIEKKLLLNFMYATDSRVIAGSLTYMCDGWQYVPYVTWKKYGELIEWKIINQ